MQHTVHPPYNDPFNWLVRNRETGRVVLVQWPNVPLAVFLAATALKLLMRPSGTFGLVIGLVATVALVTWALLEIFRGASPFRRILGGLVLFGQLMALVPR